MDPRTRHYTLLTSFYRLLSPSREPTEKKEEEEREGGEMRKGREEDRKVSQSRAPK